MIKTYLLKYQKSSVIYTQMSRGWFLISFGQILQPSDLSLSQDKFIKIYPQKFPWQCLTVTEGSERKSANIDILHIQ